MGEEVPSAVNEAMRLVGYILLLWGQLETRISYGIYQLTPDFDRKNTDPKLVARMFHRILAEWITKHRETQDKQHVINAEALNRDIKAASDIRNAICHGFSGIITYESPPYATICCYEKYHHNRMVHGSMRQVFYTVTDLAKETEHLKAFITRVSDLNQSAFPKLNEKKTPPTDPDSVIASNSGFPDSSPSICKAM